MTTSSHAKVAEQLKGKPAVLAKFLKFNKPKVRKNGITVQQCERCGRFGGHIKQYGLHLCRQCFRDIAEEIGFKKYS
jgi:small subunit ribosomal protein S14